MDDRVRAAERLDRLAEVGQVRAEERRLRQARRDDVDVHDVVTVLDEVVHDGPTGLAAATGDHDLAHRRRLRSMPVARDPWTGSAGCSNPGSIATSAARRSSSQAPNARLRSAASSSASIAGRASAIGHGRGRRHGLDPRDVPAVLGPDRPEDRPRPRREDRVLERAAELAAMDVAQVAAHASGCPASIDDCSASASMSPPCASRSTTVAAAASSGSRTCRTRRASRRR